MMEKGNNYSFDFFGRFSFWGYYWICQISSERHTERGVQQIGGVAGKLNAKFKLFFNYFKDKNYTEYVI